MNWEKAKIIAISILIILNGIFFGLNMKNFGRHNITPEREKAIHSVLADNKIGIYTPVITDYEPMREISAVALEPDRELLRELFFGDSPAEIILTETGEQITGAKGSLSLSANRIDFSVPGGEGGNISLLSEEDAKRVSELYMAEKSAVLGDGYVFHSAEYRRGEYRLKYYREYRGETIFCAGCEFLVSEQGITWFSASLYEDFEYTGSRREICAADDALLTLVHELEDSENTRFISSLERGYDFCPGGNVSESTGLKLSPCYFIGLQDMDEPIVINAFTNEPVSE
ncbi:MAG: hypothetical protein IJC39_03115 [Firmicutes bacterium]|nr:hypothetical protein [Bacillota bacterium]